MPARLRSLAEVDRNTALGLMQEAEERGQRVLDEAEAAFSALNLEPIGNDDWDEAGFGDDDEDDDKAEGEDLEDSVCNVPARDDLPPSTSTTCAMPEPSSPLLPNENLPDPFHIPDLATATSPPLSQNPVHSHPAIHLLYIVVAWLHTHFHVPFVACNAVLVIFVHILSLATTPVDVRDSYRTLPSVMTHLGVDPIFVTLPVCPVCFEVHASSLSAQTRCVRCASPIFKLTSPGQQSQKPKPILQFPTVCLEQQLRQIIEIDGMEDILEEWCYLPRSPGEYNDNFDGEICKTVEGHDERPFFENPRPPDTQDELRIGLTLGVDWSAPHQITYFLALIVFLSGFHIFEVKLPRRIPRAQCPSTSLICHHIFGLFPLFCSCILLTAQTPDTEQSI
jgi:hypothetical protein